MLITGASGGIGEAVANRLAERKHNVLLVARSKSKLKALVEELTNQRQILVKNISAYLSKENVVEKIFEETQKR